MKGFFDLYFFTLNFYALNWGKWRNCCGYTAGWTYFIASSSSIIICSLTGTGAPDTSIFGGKVMWKRWSRNDFLYKVYFKLLFIIINFHYPILLDGIFSNCFHNGFLRSDLGILWLHEWALQYWWKSLDWNDILPFLIVYYHFVLIHIY